MPEPLALVELIAQELHGADLEAFLAKRRVHIDVLVRALAKAGARGADHHAVALALQANGARRVRHGKSRARRWELPMGDLFPPQGASSGVDQPLAGVWTALTAGKAWRPSWRLYLAPSASAS